MYITIIGFLSFVVQYILYRQSMENHIPNINKSYLFSYYAASSSSLPSATSVGNNCGVSGIGGKSTKRQKINHQFSGKGNRNLISGGGQPTTGPGQLLSHHAIVPDQLKLYSKYIFL